jgi:hypothetical protein
MMQNKITVKFLMVISYKFHGAMVGQEETTNANKCQQTTTN